MYLFYTNIVYTLCYRQNNDDSDRYQKEMVELRAAESLFCEENDLFIENSLKL